MRSITFRIIKDSRRRADDSIIFGPVEKVNLLASAFDRKQW